MILPSAGYFHSPGGGRNKKSVLIKFLKSALPLHIHPPQLPETLYGHCDFPVPVRLPENQKVRIEEIIKEKVNRWYDGSMRDKTVSNFVIFEERLSTSDRETNIVPVKIFDGITFIDKHDKDFDQKYYSWKEGEAIHFIQRTKRKKSK